MPHLLKPRVAGVLVLLVGVPAARATLFDYQNQVTAVGTPPSATHEPGSVGLLAAGGLALLARWRWA
jgi:MYXO-CTERM domain-containing protein